MDTELITYILTDPSTELLSVRIEDGTIFIDIIDNLNLPKRLEPLKRCVSIKIDVNSINLIECE